jgi:ribosome-associated protein
MKRTSTASRKTVDKSLPLLRLVARSLDDKKAEDLRVLDVRAQSSITDYLVLATGTSEPHLRALRVELEKAIDGAGEPIIGMESTQGSGWTVFDAFDIMVHLFTAENRAKYRLELLWKDAVEIPVPGLLAKRPVPQRKRRLAKDS